MKKFITIIAMLFVAASSQAQFSKASLQASGLTCAMCSKAVKVALEKVSFVEDVKVDIKNQKYDLKFKEGNDIDFDALKKAVEDAGFSVASLKFTANFADVKIEKDKHLVLGGKNFHFLNGNNQVLNGERTVSIVDKDFVSAKEFKKYSASSKHTCIQTGKTGSCCKEEGMNADERVYHVTI